MKLKFLKKLLIVTLIFATAAGTFAGCGNKDTTIGSSASAEAEVEPQTQTSKGGTYDFFYSEDLSEQDYNDMCDMIEQRLKALDQDKYVKIKKDYKDKTVHVTFTGKADASLFPSAFCKNEFKITDADGNTLITPDDVESVEIYEYQETGYLHFKFKAEGAARLTEATSKENPVLIYCLNGEQVNETQVVDVISDELYTAGFGNLLDLFLICIQKGPLPVDLYSTSQLYEGQQSIEDMVNPASEDQTMESTEETTPVEESQPESTEETAGDPTGTDNTIENTSDNLQE